MQKGPPFRVLGISDGDPFDPLTFSGVTRRLMGSLQDRGVLAGAVSGQAPLLVRAAQAASFAPRRRSWWQRYSAGAYPAAPLLRRARTSLALRRAAALPPADVSFQVGAWFDLPDKAGFGLRCSYHDGNLATYLRRSDVALDPTSRAVRRALDAERRIYERLDLLFPMSEWLRRSFVEDFGVDPDKVIAVGAGSNMAKVPGPVERDWSTPRLLFIGKGEFARKGGPVLLEAFARLRETYPDAELMLIGPDPIDDPPPGVTYRGRILRTTPEGEREFDEIYRRSTAYAMPSLYEPFGVAFLEAMSYGLPCVATTTCAMPEIVVDGETGLLADPGDVDGVVAALHRLAAEPETARRMGQAARERFLKRYTWDAVGDRIVAAIAARLGVEPDALAAPVAAPLPG